MEKVRKAKKKWNLYRSPYHFKMSDAKFERLKWHFKRGKVLHVFGIFLCPPSPFHFFSISFNFFFIIIFSSILTLNQLKVRFVCIVCLPSFGSFTLLFHLFFSSLLFIFRHFNMFAFYNYCVYGSVVFLLFLLFHLSPRFVSTILMP